MPIRANTMMPQKMKGTNFEDTLNTFNCRLAALILSRTKKPLSNDVWQHYKRLGSQSIWINSLVPFMRFGGLFQEVTANTNESDRYNVG